jgi:hypothetical protein
MLYMSCLTCHALPTAISSGHLSQGEQPCKSDMPDWCGKLNSRCKLCSSRERYPYEPATGTSLPSVCGFLIHPTQAPGLVVCRGQCRHSPGGRAAGTPRSGAAATPPAARSACAPAHRRMQRSIGPAAPSSEWRFHQCRASNAGHLQPGRRQCWKVLKVGYRAPPCRCSCQGTGNARTPACRDVQAVDQSDHACQVVTPVGCTGNACPCQGSRQRAVPTMCACQRAHPAALHGRHGHGDDLGRERNVHRLHPGVHQIRLLQHDLAGAILVLLRVLAPLLLPLAGLICQQLQPAGCADAAPPRQARDLLLHACRSVQLNWGHLHEQNRQNSVRRR